MKLPLGPWVLHPKFGQRGGQLDFKKTKDRSQVQKEYEVRAHRTGLRDSIEGDRAAPGSGPDRLLVLRISSAHTSPHGMFHSF